MTTLSPYKIYWIEFRALNGIVTKKDEKILSQLRYTSFGKNRRNYLKHFPSEAYAKQYLSENAEAFKKLSKSYEVRLCTDKQFSLGSVDYDNNIVNIHFTKKQESEMFIIG